jgi:hypothetical protein
MQEPSFRFKKKNNNNNNLKATQQGAVCWQTAGQIPHFHL